jgi:hypothetical protein
MCTLLKGIGGFVMNGQCDCGSKFEAQAWLWQHKVLLFALGVLLAAGLLVGGNGF